ncbi:MAG: oligoendopeptidase F [Anaerolineaceae bacterium]|nr:oligoendopeptidase F [Anaerolineaceae bacterium]
MSDLKPTHWDVSNVFPGLESEVFQAAIVEADQSIERLMTFFQKNLKPLSLETDDEQLNVQIGAYLDQLNETLTLQGKINAYLYAFISTDSYNKLALRILSEFEQITLKTNKQDISFQTWLSQFSDRIDKIITYGGTVQSHAFNLKETIHYSKFLMSEQEEGLAAELNLSGANAWEKLQGTLTSQLTVDFEMDGEVKKMPAPALTNLRAHPDEDVRRRGYEAELKAWKTIEEPLASAMNGIKGSVITLNKHRGRDDALHSALDAARIDRDTLDAMLSAMEDSFSMFRKYFRAKAKRFGQEQLPWWNLFAPVGKTDTVFSFGDARDFIVENFGKFSPDLASYAKYAFDHNWIDAEPREGKRGGAFCMEIPGIGESRILCNFDGSFDQLSTIAHELGHGFHNDCKIKAGRTRLQKRTPMTMAETASIMCETIVGNAALDMVTNPQEELAILENMIVGDSQVIVDIYSRFLFEKEVFERREKAELSADELNDIMVRAQKATYGDGLDEKYLQKYMWTWKPHYYSADLSFYNFPYTFGLLFGIGLYAIYQQRGAAFIPEYVNLLASTGLDNAADLAARFGINIRDKSFWDDSIKVIEKRVNRYLEL